MAEESNGVLSAFGHGWEFIRGYVRDPVSVGAIAPSSRALATAVSEQFRKSPRPVRVLEVGAGTGPITRYLGTLLTDRDELDVCEMNEKFADILESDVLTAPCFKRAVETERVRLLRLPFQKVPQDRQYDFVISGLPLTAFELQDVQEVFAVARRLLKPGGVFSYFEYTWLRRTSRMLALGRSRRRLRDVSEYLTQNIRAHEFAHKTVLQNIPPADARHLCFDRVAGGNGNGNGH